jgi:carboxybiotin decarboxylase
VREAGFAHLTWQNLVMFAVAGMLLYLATVEALRAAAVDPHRLRRDAREPAERLHGGLQHLRPRGRRAAAADAADLRGGHPHGVPAAGHLPRRRRPHRLPAAADPPHHLLLGAAAQIGIFVAAIGAYYLFGFSIREAASIGIIGGADGPTSIFLTAILAPELLGAVAVAAYSYMALVPVIQPPILRLLTTTREQHMPVPEPIPVTKTAVVLFPVLITLLVSLAIPPAAPLVGMLMFGNLLRESGVTDRLSKTAGGPLVNIVTILLGLVIGATMAGETFLRAQTLYILVLGAVAFVFSTAGGILLAKLLNLALPEHRRINPCIGAAGVSAVPMSARVVQRFVSERTQGRVNPLMAAMGPNVAGVIGSAVAAGVFLALLR